MSQIDGTRIPKNIYICFKHKRLPPKVMANWKRLNPDYNVFLFDDKDCIRFLMQYYGPRFVHIFNSIPDGAIKSDFWRVCILYKLGGVYADADIEPLKPIKEFVNPGIHMLTCHSMWNPSRPSTGPDTFNPHFIICEAGSPILRHCITSYLKLASSKTMYNYWLWSVTGVMAAAFRDTITNETLFDKPSRVKTDTGLLIQFLHEHGPNGEVIPGESPLVGCYSDGVEVLKNRYEDYKHWNTRTEFETRRRLATDRGIKGVTPLRRVDTSIWSSNSMRQF